MEYLPYIAVAVGFVVLAWWLNSNRIKAKNRTGDAARGGPMMERVMGFDSVTRFSPGGLRLLVEPGTEGPTDEEVGVIEAGMIHCFDKAKAQGYTKAMTLPEYTIAWLKSERSPIDQVYAFLVPDLLGQYAGTEFDKGGYVLAPEAVVAYEGRYGNLFCLADSHGMKTERDRETLFNAACYGVEHVVLFHNDLAKFKATEVHTTGGHPLF
jgi:hypothetical protein